MITPAWQLHTERLVLRPFEPRDLEPLHAIHSDEGVVRWLYNDARSFAETRELLERKIAGSAVAAGGRLPQCRRHAPRERRARRRRLAALGE